MKVGLGLPNFNQTLHRGRLLVDIARRAEALGFSSLATIGRMAYPTFEELVVLGAAAGVTERIGLMTDVLLLPTREPILLAKQAATLDQISNGRFVLGIGVGGRPDDYAVSQSEFSTRGKRLNEQLEVMHQAWRGEPVGGSAVAVCPTPYNGRSVPVMFGGRADAMVTRVARYGIGYTQGGGTPEALKAMIERVEPAWQAAGREGKPEFRALTYFVLGESAQDEAQSNVISYYGEYGKNVWANAFKSAEAAKERVKAYADAGCDEMLAFVTAPSLAQVERLAEAVL